jgi:hypothetical protein
MSTAWVVSNQRSLMRRYAPNKPTPKGWDNVVQPSPTGSDCSSKRRLRIPRVVLDPCSSAVLVHHGDKGLRKWMLAIGYCQRCALVSNTDEGGAVSSDRLVTLYTLIRSLPTSDPEDYDPLTEALTLGVTGLRAMPNLRRPCNVPRMAMVGNKSIGTRQRTRTHATVTGCSDPNSTGCPMTPTRQSY